ncbi:Protein CPR-5 [Acorus gramineus]|uniref:Protein CPR-5 n=1 Tax=Acorus gramineus TaxID=55184 RepID=A0AAV9AHZ2_ACOGR|nr:Protein CPR-5 [Acorus gramineus]
MSVAVVMSEVLERQNTSELIPAARLSMICSLAVKESIANVYGDRFDRFVTNFESSFHSTLNTLRSISGAMSHEQNSPPSTSRVENIGIEDCPTRSSSKHVRTTMEFSASTSCTENLGSEDCLIPVSSRNTNPPEEVPEHQITGCLDNQISIYGQMSEELSLVSVNHAAPTENLSVLERFAAEQARANKLKEVELGLTLKQMELKKMQLNLNYDANSLTRTKISMGIMDASFRKEKFKNQVEETRNAEFLNKCKDCLIVGLFVMSGCLIYGAKTFAYNRIMEMTEACTTFTKEPKSWWVPKPMDSFSSGLRMLRCHVIAISRISFGVLMILAIGYSIMQRPGTTSSVMPVTYYLLLLGSLCGLAGKFCIETLGGSGYVWLLHWEPLILLHFFANVNPSAFYNFLYGPVSVSPGDKVVRMPYLIRRVTFYSVVFFFLPVLAGLMPFASPIEWKDHFVILITGSDA